MLSAVRRYGPSPLEVYLRGVPTSTNVMTLNSVGIDTHIALNQLRLSTQALPLCEFGAGAARYSSGK